MVFVVTEKLACQSPFVRTVAGFFLQLVLKAKSGVCCCYLLGSGLVLVTDLIVFGARLQQSMHWVMRSWPQFSMIITITIIEDWRECSIHSSFKSGFFHNFLKMHYLSYLQHGGGFKRDSNVYWGLVCFCHLVGRKVAGIQGSFPTGDLPGNITHRKRQGIRCWTIQMSCWFHRCTNQKYACQPHSDRWAAFLLPLHPIFESCILVSRFLSCFVARSFCKRRLKCCCCRGLIFMNILKLMKLWHTAAV